MKRSILLAIVAVLVSAVSAFAEKEYNMVITLNNGTTITLGHNDIKNITFNDGEISISGDVMNTIDELQKFKDDLHYWQDQVECTISQLQHWVDNLEGRVSYIESILQNNGFAAPQHSSQTKELPMHIESFNSDQVRAALKSTMEKMHKPAATAE